MREEFFAYELRRSSLPKQGMHEKVLEGRGKDAHIPVEAQSKAQYNGLEGKTSP